MTSGSSSLGRLAVRNTVWLTLFAYASQFISFVATIVLTRLLGPQVFGLFAIGSFWASLLALRGKFGITYAALRQPTIDGELFGSFYRLDLIISSGSVMLGVLAAIILPLIGYAPEVGTVVIILSVVEFLPALIGPLGLALEKELQLSRLTAVSLISTTLSYGLAIVLALGGGGLWSLLVMSLLNTIIGLSGVYWVFRRRLPRLRHVKWTFSRPLARQLLKQGLPIGLANQGQATIVNQYDNFLIGTFVSTTALGFYDRAYRLSQWPNVLLAAALQRVGFLTFAKVQNDLPRLTHAMRLSLWVLTTLGTPLALAVLFGASDLVAILYGPEWALSAFFLRFLAIYTLLSPFIGLGGSLAYAVGNIRVTVAITLAEVVTILTVASGLTLWLGAVGTMMGVGATIVVGFIMSNGYIFRRLPLSVRSVYGGPVAAAALTALAAWLASRWAGWEALAPLLRLMATTVIVGGTYFLALFVLQRHVMIERIRYVTQTFRGTRRG